MCEINRLSDNNNCGACGRRCAAGESCTGGSCFDSSRGTFRIESLTATNCNAIEHVAATGDDRGGIGVSSTSVFYSGDSRTGRFALDLSAPTMLGTRYEAMVSDIASGTLYTLGTSATTAVPFGGGVVTHLIQIDGLSGALTTTAITLSRSINVGNNTGIFSGRRAIGLHEGTNRAYVIELPSGMVRDLGAMPAIPHTNCESWAYWGTLEFFGGSYYFDAVQNSTTITRYQVPTSAATTLATFASLSDMCSFVLLPANGRWYFHHEGNSQFRSGDETLGYCDATFSSP